MLEKELWNVVRGGMSNLWRAQRVEDSMSPDIPDVYFTIRNGLHSDRLGGWLELKCQEPRKRGGVNARHYTQGQRDFAQLHQTVFLLLYSSGWFMLFDHHTADDILRGQTLEWHRDQALYASTQPAWSQIVVHLACGLKNC
jgi:hypothetical protein